MATRSNHRRIYSAFVRSGAVVLYLLLFFGWGNSAYSQVKIDTRIFQEYTTWAPYRLCSSDPNLKLKASGDSITWTCTIDSAVHKDSLFISKLPLAQVITIYATAVDSLGGRAQDSVHIQIDGQASLKLTGDTAVTWVKGEMQVQVKAEYEHASEVYWLPLNGGKIDDQIADSTMYRFELPQVNRTQSLRLYCQTKESGRSVCPFADGFLSVNVYQTPQTEVKIDFDPDDQTLTAWPGDTNLLSYEWKVAGEIKTSKTVVFNLKEVSDSLVTVRLLATNAIGASAYSYNVLDLKTGGTFNLERTLTMYPNPVQDVLTLNTSQSIVNRTAYLYDAVGKVVQEQVLTSNALKLNDLAPGTYTIVIHCDKCVTLTGKFVKE